MAKIVVSFSESMVDKLESKISSGNDFIIDYDGLDGDIHISSDSLTKDELEEIAWNL